MQTTLSSLLKEWIPGPEEQAEAERDRVENTRWRVQARVVKGGFRDANLPRVEDDTWETLAVFPTRQECDTYVVQILPKLYPHSRVESQVDKVCLVTYQSPFIPIRGNSLTVHP